MIHKISLLRKNSRVSQDIKAIYTSENFFLYIALHVFTPHTVQTAHTSLKGITYCISLRSFLVQKRIIAAYKNVY